MKEFLQRLTSRKFLLTIAGITLVTLFPERSGEIVTLIVTFIGAEGVADTVDRYATQTTVQKQIDHQMTQLELGGGDSPADVDKSAFTPGYAADTPM